MLRARSTSSSPDVTDDCEVLVVYDQRCPACDAYCRRVEVDEAEGRLTLVDARRESEVMAEITAAGLDIDQGMVVKHRDALHYGSDAIHVLATLGPRQGGFNRLSRWLFGSRGRANLLYPPLRMLRNLLLKLLRLNKINNLKLDRNDHF